jgi:hypothetical protein
VSLAPFSTTSPTTTRVQHLLLALRRHRLYLLAWSVPFTLLALATVQHDVHLGQWALLLGVVVALVCATRLARWVVRRVTQIVALWEEDVPQAEGVARLYAVPARHRGSRSRDHA